MTGLFDFKSHMPPSLRYSRYLANSGLAVVFFFLRRAKKLRRGWLFFSLLFPFFVGFLWRLKSPKVEPRAIVLEGLDPQEGKLVLLLNPSFKSAVVTDSLPNLSYLAGPLRVLMDLNMVGSCCVKDKSLNDVVTVERVRAKRVGGNRDEWKNLV